MPVVRMALVFLAAHVASALFFVLDRAPGTSAALAGLPLDDAWIHLVYARSLAALQGFAYNPGQLETGSSSPLWAILLVPATWTGHLLGVSVVLPVKLTGLLVGVGASIAAAALVARLGMSRLAQVVAGLAIAVDPALAFAQVSGMEVLLAGGLGLWAAAELAAERHWPAALAAALLPLARPEMAVLTVAVLALLEWRLHRRKGRVLDRVAVLGPSLVLVGGWVVYCFLVSGHPLPSTFYAKFSSSPRVFSHNVVLLLAEVLPSWSWFAYGAGFVLWAVGGAALVRRGWGGALAALFPLAYLLVVAGSQHISESWPFYWQRYWLPALPFVLVALTAGAVAVVAWARRQGSWLRGRALVAAALVLGALAGGPTAFERSADLYAWNCQNIDELNVATAKWLRDHVPAGETIAVTDAGAARYFADHPIFDLLGLNHHRFLHRARADRGLEPVRWVASFPQLVPFLRERAEWEVAHRETTAHLTICDCPQSELLVFRRSN